MLTGFQFKVSRAILDLHYEQLAGNVGLHFSTMKRIEDETPNLTPLKSQLSTVILLTRFFNKQGIYFPASNIVTINKNTSSAGRDSLDKITRFQLKGARVALKLTQKELGEQVKIPQSTISDLEIKYKNEQFLKLDPAVARFIKSFFIQHGVIFPSPVTIELKTDKIPF